MDRGRGLTLSNSLNTAFGARKATLFREKFNLHTVAQLLRHYPRKYNRRGELTDLRLLVEGERATVVAKVTAISQREFRRKNVRGPNAKLRVAVLTISDGTRFVECSFFNQHGIPQRFPVGSVGMFSGKVKRFNSVLQISSPVAESFSDDDPQSAEVVERLEHFVNGLIPIYPLSEGVTLWTVQSSVKLVLDQIDEIPDPLPPKLLEELGYTDLRTALFDIHRPSSEHALKAAQERLRFDEALAMQLVLAQRRAAMQSYPAEPCPPMAGMLLDSFDERLPFELTDGQREVGQEISQDLSGIHPMNRLLQGEVGSGKTVVALRAMLQVIDNQRQTVLMAPTEVLASQHARSVREVLGPLAMGGELGAAPGATKVTLLTGSLGATARKQALLDIASGQAGIAVGTHALLGKDVHFENLGLVVVDEQHRFGVEQRDQLRTGSHENNPPHVLVMTATPIPRTVAMTVYGDLVTSSLRELPKGRTPIKTTVVPSASRPLWLERAWERVREEVAQGRQVYIVCPRIGDELDPGGRYDETDYFSADEDDEADAADQGADGDDGTKRPPLAVVDVAAQLTTGPLAGLRLAVLHGRLNANDKDDTMAAFKQGQLDVLVATTVIEVGVDVPNATMMVILDADRFGMSQLHQLRGRVGRGKHPGMCLLVSEMPEGSTSMQRLEAVAGTLDGFEVARADLSQRREGDILGRIQAGRSSGLKLLSVLEHEEIIAIARKQAISFVSQDAKLRKWPGLAALVEQLFGTEEQKFLEKG